MLVLTMDVLVTGTVLEAGARSFLWELLSGTSSQNGVTVDYLSFPKQKKTVCQFTDATFPM